MTSRRKVLPSIPHYRGINEFLASISESLRTLNPDFFCLRLHPGDNTIINYKPPFRKDFYFISLIADSRNTKIIYDTTSEEQLDSFLVLQSPNQIYSFHRDAAAHGYIIYFRKELFGFLKSSFEQDFPFFDVLHTGFFKMNHRKFLELEPEFDSVFRAYEKAPDSKHELAVYRFLALLVQLRGFTTAWQQWQTGFSSQQDQLYRNFLQLVSKFYIEKRTVEEYAEMLRVTSNHLSKTIKSRSGQNALHYINERLLQEAKSLIRHTDVDIATITFQLGFSDPANFGKFFRKHTGMSPLEFRGHK